MIDQILLFFHHAFLLQVPTGEVNITNYVVQLIKGGVRLGQNGGDL